jgi:AcrR family transcriptional regulator
METHTEPRIPLSRDRILQAALDLADEGGIESLTIRKLGQVLGFQAMSLSNHVANKDDVLDGILDLVWPKRLPSPAGDWDTAIRSSAISVTTHSGVTPGRALLMSPGHVRPARLRYRDSLLGRLRDAGFSAETTYHVYHVLDGHIFGFSLWQTSHSYTPAEVSDMVVTFARTISADEYPHLHEHGNQHVSEGPHRDVSAFEFGLDLILDGLKKVRHRRCRPSVDRGERREEAVSRGSFEVLCPTARARRARRCRCDLGNCSGDRVHERQRDLESDADSRRDRR